MPEQPLAEVKVLDLTQHVAGPYCTKLLADYGAEVIKVERPGCGDLTRRIGPFPGDIPHHEKSGLFLHLNTNKLGITLNLKSETGQKILKELVKETDILVESFRPGVTASWGISYQELCRVNPQLIMTSVTNFGQTGPYRDYRGTELVLFAMGGPMNRMGLPDREPLKLAGNEHIYQAGHCAAMATLFAFYGRQYKGNGGEYIDVSIHETMMSSINSGSPRLLVYSYTGERSERVYPGGGGFPNGFYPCQDGLINIAGGLRSWANVAALLGMPELLHDPRFATPEGQANPANKEIFEETIWFPWLMERTMNEAVEAMQAHEIWSAAVNSIDDAVHCPQFAARDYFIEVEHPAAGRVRLPGAPFKNDDHWWQVRQPAPLLGQHNEGILGGRLGYSREDLMLMSELSII